VVYLSFMATTTHHKETAMTTTSTAIYLNDNGRATCADHAGEYLRASIAADPTAQFHTTPLGTWERFTADDIRIFGEDINCDCCGR
jgi:hypothetical protein